MDTCILVKTGKMGNREREGRKGGREGGGKEGTEKYYEVFMSDCHGRSNKEAGKVKANR